MMGVGCLTVQIYRQSLCLGGPTLGDDQLVITTGDDTELVNQTMTPSSPEGAWSLSLSLPNCSDTLSIEVTTANGISRTVTQAIDPCTTNSVTFEFVDHFYFTILGCDSTFLSSATYAVTSAGSSVAGTFSPYPPTGTQGGYYFSPSVDLYTSDITVAVTYAGRTQTITTSPSAVTSDSAGASRLGAESRCALAFPFLTRLSFLVEDFCQPYLFDGVTLADAHAPLAGATVSFTVVATGCTLSATTDSNGIAYFDMFACGIAPGDSITWTASFANHVMVFDSLGTVISSASIGPITDLGIPGLCGVPYESGSYDPRVYSPNGISWLAPDSTHCCPLCFDGSTPAGTVIPKTLSVDDGFGAVSLTGSAACVFTGCALRTSAHAYALPNPLCIDFPSSSVPVFFYLTRSGAMYIGTFAAVCAGVNSYPQVGPNCSADPGTPFAPASGMVWMQMGGVSTTSTCYPTDIVYTSKILSSSVAANAILGQIYGYDANFAHTLTQ